MSILNTPITNSSPTRVFPPSGYSAQTAITAIYICNTGVGNLNFNVHVIPAIPGPGVSSSADSSNILYWNISLTAGDTYVIDSERLVLSPNDAIYVSSTSSSGTLTVTVSYMGI
jgi:hypothetical protein